MIALALSPFSGFGRTLTACIDIRSCVFSVVASFSPRLQVPGSSLRYRPMMSFLRLAMLAGEPVNKSVGNVLYVSISFRISRAERLVVAETGEILQPQVAVPIDLGALQPRREIRCCGRCRCAACQRRTR